MRRRRNGARKKPAQKRYGNGLAGFGTVEPAGAEVTLRIDSTCWPPPRARTPMRRSKEAAEELRKIVSTWGVRAAGRTHPLRGERQHAQRGLGRQQRDAHPGLAGVSQPVAVRAGGGTRPAAHGLHARSHDRPPDRRIRGHLRRAVLADSVQGPRARRKTPPEDRPKHEVMALPERKRFEIRFPVVEGFVVDLANNLIACDVAAMEPIRLDPIEQPDGRVRSAAGRLRSGHAWARKQASALSWSRAKRTTQRHIRKPLPLRLPAKWFDSSPMQRILPANDCAAPACCLVSPGAGVHAAVSGDTGGLQGIEPLRSGVTDLCTAGGWLAGIGHSPR
jgi:hypothetical protein